MQQLEALGIPNSLCCSEYHVCFVSGEGFAQLIAVGHFREDTKFLLQGQCLKLARKPAVVNVSWL